MKLYALANHDRGGKDLDDAREPAKHLGVTDEGDLRHLFVSMHDKEPPGAARVRFPAVLGR